jgi:hypothetical protein
VVGHGAHVPVRAPGGDHQAVGDGALAFEVDEDDVLGLVVVEAGQDQIFQSGDPTLGVLRAVGARGRGGGLLRTRRGLTVQRGAPMVSSPDKRNTG